MESDDIRKKFSFVQSADRDFNLYNVILNLVNDIFIDAHFKGGFYFSDRGERRCRDYHVCSRVSWMALALSVFMLLKYRKRYGY